MENPKDLIAFLKNIPAFAKGVITFYLAIIPFFLLFREHQQLIITIIISSLIFFALAASIYAAFVKTNTEGKETDKTDAKIQEGKTQYRYAKYRIQLLVFIIINIVLVIVLISLEPTRSYAIDAIFGTHTPTLTPTNTPTLIPTSTKTPTLIPTSTATISPTPTPTKIALQPADILIAEFDSKHASRTLDLAHRLESALQSELSNSGLENIDVRVWTDSIISNEDGAQVIANDTGSKAIIWGWYDDIGIQVNIFLSGGANPGKEFPGTNVLPLELSGNNNQLNFVIQDVLPDNISFLSLFVIGHLYYEANEYQAGHNAFNAAMLTIPDNVALVNEAIIHFFQARLLETEGNHDLTEIICKYAQAIEIDPSFAEAYNNLGVLFSSFQTDPSIFISREAITCLQNAGIDENDFYPTDLFNQALVLRPGWALAEYNKLAKYWEDLSQAYHSDDYSSENLIPELVADLEKINSIDQSILGVYPMLANIALFEENNPERATSWLVSGVDEFPENEYLHINAGQLYLIQGLLEEAKNEFYNALSLDPTNPEAHLAMANIKLQENLPVEAERHIQSVLSAPEQLEQVQLGMIVKLFSPSPKDAAWVLKSKIFFDNGLPEKAIQSLENIINNAYYPGYMYPYEKLLLGLLFKYIEDDYTSNIYLTQVFIPLTKENNTTSAITLDKIAENCEAIKGYTEENDWIENDACLPANLDDRINLLYDYFLETLQFRLYYQSSHYGGAACPYVFTFGRDSNKWEFDTTILYMQEGLENDRIQIRPLNNFDGQIMIREIEPEISYIDSIFIMVEDKHGRYTVLQPQLKVLVNNDNEYLILKMGEEIVLNFNGFEKIKDPLNFWIIAKGFYNQIHGLTSP